VEEHEHNEVENPETIQKEPIQQQVELISKDLKNLESNNADEKSNDLDVQQVVKNDKIDDAPLDKIQSDQKPKDLIVRLIKDQEPLSYRVGEKMMEEKKHNLSISVEKDSNKHAESEKLPEEKSDQQIEDKKPLESEKHVEDVPKKVEGSNENLENIQEDPKNEMRKKRDTYDLDDLLKSNPIDLQLKSIISRDLKAVKDEAR
jgi:hypothetical protein